jgi:hypothetical protein
MEENVHTVEKQFGKLSKSLLQGFHGNKPFMNQDFGANFFSSDA